MTFEESLKAALDPLVASRVYAGKAPAKVAKPYIVYQQVGGGAVNFVENAAPGMYSARIQVSVWGATRLGVSPLARQVQATLQASGLGAKALAAHVDTQDDDTGLVGTRQDFGFWHAG